MALYGHKTSLASIPSRAYTHGQCVDLCHVRISTICGPVKSDKKCALVINFKINLTYSSLQHKLIHCQFNVVCHLSFGKVVSGAAFRPTIGILRLLTAY